MNKFVAGSIGLLFATASVGVGRAETPDFMAEVLRGDGVGYVDTGYSYKAGTTSSVTCDLHIVNRGVTATSKFSRGLFGFWNTAGGSTDISAFRFYGQGGVNEDDLQYWKATTDCKSSKSYNSVSDLLLSVDYDAAKVYCNGDVFSDSALVPSADSSKTYWVFSICGNSSSGTQFDLKRMTICEKSGEVCAPVRDLTPCFANGRAALYDSVNAKIYYPTTTGFVLSGYDLSLASGKTLSVNAASCAPRTLTLASGCELSFDGESTLHSESTATLPASGTVTISQTAATGKGKYVLIDSLSADYDLSTFKLGELPPGYSGVLSKDGSKLVLTLTANGFFPEAMAGILKGDLAGHVDTDYLYVYQKTSKLVFDFRGDSKRYLGDRSGDQSRAFFGFYKLGSAISWLRIYGSGSREWDVVTYSYGSAASVKAKDIAGYWEGESSVVVDYANGKVSFDGSDTVLDAPAPTANSTISCWMFDINGLSAPAPIELREMKIYEQDAQNGETLVRDFVPAIVNGASVAYDRVTQTVKTPTSDGFTTQDLSYRLAVNGEVIYVTGTVSVVAADATTAQGWVAIADSDNHVVARGTGSTASFTMPSEAVSVMFGADLEVAAGETLSISSSVAYNTLTLGKGATLSFADGGLLAVATDLVLPGSGEVNVAFEGANAPGNQRLICGIDDTLELSAFSLTSLPPGCLGALSRQGESVVLSLSRNPSTTAALVAKVLKGDGTGYFDTGYYYTYTDAVKTSKITADFYSANRGMGSREVGVSSIHRSLLGFLDASSKQISYLKFTGTGKDENDAVQMWGYSYANNCTNVSKLTNYMLGDLSFVIDYTNAKGSFDGGSTTFDLTAPTKTAPRTYWLLNANGNGVPAAIDLYKMDIYENRNGSEVLAHRYLPALRGDDKAVVYDAVTQAILVPTSELSVDFGTVEQEFFTVSTVSEGMPVAVPEFAGEREFTFVRDGSVTAKFAMSSLTLTRYDAEGAVLATAENTAVAAGSTFAVELEGAAKLVVTVSGAAYAAEKTVAQEFDSVSVLGVAPSAYRLTRKRNYELAIAGAVTLTFKSDIASVYADDYDASGNLVSTTQVSGAAEAGATCEVAATTSAYRILRITEASPGMLLLIH